jgi:hypothetical protein
MDHGEKKTLKLEDIETTRTGRRSALRSIAGSVLGAAALVAGGTVARRASAEEPDALCSDSDPNDPVGRGRHCSDPGGRGTHCSDSDPNDPVGNGRRCSDSD